MTGRVLVFVSLLPLSALAQIQIYQFDGATEKAVAATFDVGAATPGDIVETRFKVRNMGNGPAIFQTLALSGQGFRISTAPSLPYTIAPANEAEFRVVFSPTVTGSYSASLAVNTINIALRGSSVAAASLTLAGNSAPLMAGAVIDFGSVVRGASQLQSYNLFNSGGTSLTVNNLSVSGTGFRGPIGLAAPIQLAPGQTASFQIAFEPQNGQPAQGTLKVDQRAFNLKGLGLDPPLPGAAIILTSTLGASAQQNSVSILLTSASAVSGTGTLTLEFHPSVPGVSDDPAVQFLSGPKRAATATISAGDAMAKFGGQSSIAFQTGATAGMIVFTLKLSNGSQQQATLTIAPAPVNFDMATSIRKFGELDVSLAGFDNTYSASQLTFTFYNSKGATIQPGAIRVDVSSTFQQYFASTQAGGMFALLAKFPMTGDSNQVASVDVQITNAAGVTTAQRVPILN
jgi:hypothetical protein